MNRELIDDVYELAQLEADSHPSEDYKAVVIYPEGELLVYTLYRSYLEAEKRSNELGADAVSLYL